MPFPRASSVVLPEAASGLRPGAIFVGFALVLAVVVGRATWIHVARAGEQPEPTATIEAPVGGFDIVDRDGRALALSVECFDVTVSPRALWRSHTPERMAQKLADVLREARTSREDAELLGDPREILRRTLPETFTHGPLPGRLVPVAPRLLDFDVAQAERVRSWLDRGVLPGADEATDDGEPDGPARGPIRGLGLVRTSPDGATPRYSLAMDPVQALGRPARVDRFGEWENARGQKRTAPPDRWTRRLLFDLLELVGPERARAVLTDSERAELARLAPTDADEKLADAIWAELVPTRFRVLARAVDPETAHRIEALMASEAVSPYQIRLLPRIERRHPTRPGGLAVAPRAHGEDAAGALDDLAVAGADDAFTLLGHWGHLDVERADARARRDLVARPHVFSWDESEDPFGAYREALVVERRPWSGIELLCQTQLEDGAWAPLAQRIFGRRYDRRVRHVARDRRREHDGPVPNYFHGAREGSGEPIVRSTLDARLQEVLHAELGALLDEHVPALAMGIVVDVPTGDVLALDARSLYGYSGYAPLLHQFTPGSTFKAVVMAQALDAGHVRPGDMFPTYAPRGIELREGRAYRLVEEADGAPTAGEISAAEGLAQSCNAVLIQVAHRFAAADLERRLRALGYGERPGAGLGPERPGTLPPLDRGTWSRIYTHASVAFGHELTVTLWQHAGALATILRGGERRPLRLLSSIERDGEVHALPAQSPVRVLSERACADVRAMLALGAETGTGDRVARREQHPEFSWIGTKTGTTEKVPTEVCAHVELEALAEHALGNRLREQLTRAALLAEPRPHSRGSCYTSSMMASAKCTVDGVERHLMVLVVAEDPAGSERFGSRVSGPTAIAVLRQAFGLSRERADESEDDAPAEAPRPAARGPVLFTASRAGTGNSGAYDARWLDEGRPWAPARAMREDRTGEER
ncbi:MAG: penicillin-binding transpeptidase domain-containing protein [Planctomycetota bacterium]